MSQPSNKRPRIEVSKPTTTIDELRESIKNHATKVNRGLEEGEFVEDDITVNCRSSKIEKFKKRNDFQILPMKYQGKVTGWGKCTLCASDPSKKPVFKISEGMSGLKVWLVERHLETNHATDEEKKIAKNKRRDEKLRQQGQVPMSDFIQRRQLTPAQISELREINLQIISSTHVPLSFFSKEVVRKRDERLLEMCGFDPKNARKFDKTRETVKQDARKISNENMSVIRNEAERWADDGRLAFMLDHKATKNTHGDKEENALGVAITITDDNHKRYHYLLDYIPCQTQETDDTVMLARDVLQVNFANIIILFQYLT